MLHGAGAFVEIVKLNAQCRAASVPRCGSAADDDIETSELAAAAPKRLTHDALDAIAIVRQSRSTAADGDAESRTVAAVGGADHFKASALQALTPAKHVIELCAFQ
jgi:hypothetical protein